MASEKNGMYSVPKLLRAAPSLARVVAAGKLRGFSEGSIGVSGRWSVKEQVSRILTGKPTVYRYCQLNLSEEIEYRIPLGLSCALFYVFSLSLSR